VWLFALLRGRLSGQESALPTLKKKENQKKQQYLFLACCFSFPVEHVCSLNGDIL